MAGCFCGWSFLHSDDLNLCKGIDVKETDMSSEKAMREISHGRLLAQGDPEAIWGWQKPAGQIRARRRADLIASAGALESGQYVLEVGCGSGFFTSLFAKSGARIVAVDISPDLLDLARDRNLPEGQVVFLQSRFEDCIEIGPFDAIVGSSVLHHLDIEPALANIYKLLKTGGKLSFAEPNMLNPQIAIQKNIPWIKKMMGDSPDETAFTKNQMKRLLIANGFKDIRIIPFDWLHPSTPVPLIHLVQNVGKIVERVPLLREFAGSLLITARRG